MIDVVYVIEKSVVCVELSRKPVYIYTVALRPVVLVALVVVMVKLLIGGRAF